MTVIRNGLIHDMVQEKPYRADIRMRDGKIAEIGTDLADETIIDAEGMHVYPGFVEAHSHLGLHGHGIGFEGQDYNELGDVCTPQLRAIDSFNPLDPTVAMAADAGITCAATGQGSSNAIGGQWIAVKTHGVCADDMIVRDPIAMKCALGENPKRVYREKGNDARMSTAAVIRRMIRETQDYMARREAAGNDPLRMPAYNEKCEAMIPVLRKEIPLKVHAHQANDIFTAVRIAREFGLLLTLEHVTEGHLIADRLAACGDIPMAVGPTLTHASKFELQNKSWTTPGILASKGCMVSIITDSPVIPEQYLPLCAGMAVKAGMDPFEAMKAITINPARHIGIADRVGTLEPGKDADLVICDGSPLEISTRILRVFIDGEPAGGEMYRQNSHL